MRWRTILALIAAYIIILTGAAYFTHSTVHAEECIPISTPAHTLASQGYTDVLTITKEQAGDFAVAIEVLGVLGGEDEPHFLEVKEKAVALHLITLRGPGGDVYVLPEDANGCYLGFAAQAHLDDFITAVHRVVERGRV